MSTDGLHFIGLLRLMSGGVIALGAFVAIILIAVIIARRIIKKAEATWDDEEVIIARTWTNRIAGILLFMAIATFVLQFIMTAATNRMPRADVDKSAVYDQMDSHGNK